MIQSSLPSFLGSDYRSSSQGSTQGDQALPTNTSQIANHPLGIFCTGGLDHRQVKTVSGKTLQLITLFHKLDQKRRGPTFAPWPAIEITQQGRLVFTTQKDFGLRKAGLAEIGARRTRGRG